LLDDGGWLFRLEAAERHVTDVEPNGGLEGQGGERKRKRMGIVFVVVDHACAVVELVQSFLLLPLG
jgi:hypothetical protein